MSALVYCEICAAHFPADAMIEHVRTAHPEHYRHLITGPNKEERA